VVEAVTGAGKTRVGLRAIADHVASGGKSAVVVPTKELLHQWTRELSRIGPQITIGRLGDGYQDNLHRCDVLVSTVNSARVSDFQLQDCSGLLVVDECHRCGSEVSRMALAATFERRLGLSATHARLDGTHETVIEPYFGGVVYRFGYADAIAQRVVAHFKVALIAVHFTEEERAQYEYLNDKVRRARVRLIEGYDVPPEPFGAFMKAVNRLRLHGSKREGIAAGQYLSAFNRRRELLAETMAKYDGLAKLEDAIRSARRVIVFTQTVRAAELAASELVDLGVDAQVLHGALERDERREVLARFARGHLHTIVAPQVLDEGLDVPDADLGIIVAASRQRRQMIQRMGRVLRPKDDGRLARFAVLYVQGTSEDPVLGAHETFLEEVLSLANSVRDFGMHATPADICSYLEAKESFTA
jgi:superfamily II DNA or RNA helicase